MLFGRCWIVTCEMRHVDACGQAVLNRDRWWYHRVRALTCRCTWPLHDKHRDIYSAPQWKCPYGNVTRVRALTCRCTWPLHDEHGEMEMSLGLGHRHVDARDHCMMTIDIYSAPQWKCPYGNVTRVRASTCRCTWPVYDEHGEMDVWLGLGRRHVDACDHCMMNIETYTVPHNGNVHMEMSLGLVVLPHF